MSLGRIYLICLGLALISVFIAPPSRYVTEGLTTISYGFPIQFIDFYSTQGEEPSRWELFTFQSISFQLVEWLLSAAGYFLVFAIIKLFRDKFKKDREETV
ncbi:hypothetical protein MKX54_06860 [Alkalihalobacillus sp. FSL R5-0424]